MLQPQQPFLARASAWSPKLLAVPLAWRASCSHPASPGGWLLDAGHVSVFGDKVNYLYQFMMWFMVAIFVVVEAALVYALWVYRRKPNEERAPEQWTHNTQLELVWTAVPFLILVAIMFPTIDALRYFANVPAAASEQANRSTTAMPLEQYKLPEHGAKPAHGEVVKPELISTSVPNEDLIDPNGQAGVGPAGYAGHENDVITLEVIGHQFWWEYRYTDPWINAS
jgi:heme/copper-type cytochrome/quinol oxidase subunit 2